MRCFGAITILLIFTQKYGEHRAEFDIRTLGAMRGRLPAKATALVVEWAALHQEELLERWKQAQNHLPLEKIEPLL